MNSSKLTGTRLAAARAFPGRMLTVLVLLSGLFLGHGLARGEGGGEFGHDLMLTVVARKAMFDDRELGPLNLGVRVHHRVATLWGTVPSPVLAQRAVQTLKRLPELVQVVNELYLAEEIDAMPPRPPGLEPARIPGLPSGTLTKHTTERPVKPVLAESSWQAVQPGPDPRMPDHRELEVVLPSLRLPTPPLSDPAAAALDRILEKSVHDLRGDLPSHGIEVKVKHGMVTLSGEAAPALYDFAHAVSHLPGVKRVVVKEQ